jgi:hypothetical protein
MAKTASIPLTERECRTLVLILEDATWTERPENQQRDIRSMLLKLRGAVLQ